MELVEGFMDWYVGLLEHLLARRILRFGGVVVYRRLAKRLSGGESRGFSSLLGVYLGDASYWVSNVDFVATCFIVYLFGYAGKWRVDFKDLEGLSKFVPSYLEVCHLYDQGVTWKDLLKEDIAHIYVLKIGNTWVLRQFSRFLNSWALDYEKKYEILEMVAKRIVEKYGREEGKVREAEELDNT